jgi:hypothetical protein
MRGSEHCEQRDDLGRRQVAWLDTAHDLSELPLKVRKHVNLISGRAVEGGRDS